MKKQSNIKLVPLIVVAVAYYFCYIFTTEAKGLEKLFGYAFAILIITPIAFNCLMFTIKIPKPKKVYTKTGDEIAEPFGNTLSRLERLNMPSKTSEPVIVNKEPIIFIPNRKSKAEDPTSETYKAIRSILINCSKTKVFTRDDVLNILMYINLRLGKIQNHYIGFEFKNEMHEIYTKLKNRHLNENDYKNILTIIQTIINEKVEDSND